MQMPGRDTTIKGSYRFGFNGQESSSELNDNLYTAKYWQYDSRIGRRWNLDPKPTVGVSQYSVFNDNPIWFSDILGDTTQPHADIINTASKINDPNASNVLWTTGDVIKWKTTGGSKYLFERKETFIKHYSNVLKDAASKFDIPIFLLAGVAFNEYGGDPMWIDDVADDVRSFDWSGPKWVDNNLTITKNPNLTSFGNISIQVRRAAETLGYNENKMTSADRSAVVSSLKNPVQNIYLAANHLSDLRMIDFSKVPTAQLTANDIKIIATRFNRGPDLPVEKIKENTSYGNTIYKHEAEINKALEPTQQ